MASDGLLKSSLGKRILMALIFAPVILWIFKAGNYPLLFLTLSVTLIGQGELFGMFGLRVSLPQRFLSFIIGAAVILDAYFFDSSFFPGLIAAALMFSFIIEISYAGVNRMEEVALTLFSTVYPSALIMFLVRLRHLQSPIFDLHRDEIMMFVIFVIWVFDSASYFAGRFFGKRRFFPTVSPKKTTEGFIGGVVGAILTGAAAGMLIDSRLLPHFIILSLLIALSGQAGDLSESIIKRAMHIKDSSKLIPGHGGILDRFDSLIFAAPVVYFYLYIQSIF